MGKQSNASMFITNLLDPVEPLSWWSHKETRHRFLKKI